MSKREPARIPVGDRDVERAIDEVRRAVVDVTRDPYLDGRDIEATLADGVEVAVKHGLGRPFTSYSASYPIGATTTGRIVERAPNADRLAIHLTATGWGATITIRLRVW
jgi:hypothetical protein